MENITNKDIAQYVDKSLNTINGWKQKQPKLLEVVKLGTYCKKNDLSIEKIQQLIKLQSMLKEDIKN